MLAGVFPKFLTFVFIRTTPSLMVKPGQKLDIVT